MAIYRSINHSGFFYFVVFIYYFFKKVSDVKVSFAYATVDHGTAVCHILNLIVLNFKA
jgi:hypothetical protein